MLAQVLTNRTVLLKLNSSTGFLFLPIGKIVMVVKDNGRGTCHVIHGEEVYKVATSSLLMIKDEKLLTPDQLRQMIELREQQRHQAIVDQIEALGC